MNVHIEGTKWVSNVKKFTTTPNPDPADDRALAIWVNRDDLDDNEQAVGMLINPTGLCNLISGGEAKLGRTPTVAYHVVWAGARGPRLMKTYQIEASGWPVPRDPTGPECVVVERLARRVLCIIENQQNQPAYRATIAITPMEARPNG